MSDKLSRRGLLGLLGLAPLAPLIAKAAEKLPEAKPVAAPYLLSRDAACSSFHGPVMYTVCVMGSTGPAVWGRF